MIPKELKASPILGEFTPKEQDRYFNLSNEKVCGHVDTLYYTVSILCDGNIIDDDNESYFELKAFLHRLQTFKAQKAMYPALSIDFMGLNFENTRFVHYEYCLRLEE